MENDELLVARGQHSVAMRRFLIEQEGRQTRELITFAVALMSILGIMAGFGFTAFQYIKISALFFIGEFVVIGSIFYVGFRIKDLLVDWATQTSNQIFDYATDAAKTKESILNGDEESKEQLAREFENAVKDTSPAPRIIHAQTINSILIKTFSAGLIGIVCILISFFHVPARDASWHHNNFSKTDQPSLNR